MNPPGKPQNVPHVPPVNPLRSIGVTIGSGLVMGGVLFTTISVIALFGFFSFQNILKNFSEKTFPQTTQEAQISILLNQLLHDTSHLLNATSQNERRIAFTAIEDQLSRVKEFVPAIWNSLPEKQKNRIEFLENSIKTFNDFIEKRIDIGENLHTARTKRTIFAQNIHNNIEQLENKTKSLAAQNALHNFDRLAYTLLLESRNATAQTSLYQLEQKQSRLSAILRELQQAALELPEPASEPAHALTVYLEDGILGANGIVALEKQYLTITNDCKERALLIRNIINKKGEASIAQFFDLTSLVASESKTLGENVNQQIRILTILFFCSLALALGYFFYFRRVLIKRLTKLNRTVLAMVAGEDLKVEDNGSDEITEIANSINYFTTELRNAKSDAEKSAEQKSDFLAHMSHEIRTPLNAILGFSDLALKTNSPTEHLDYLNKINNASHSLLGIINSVLDISKMEAGKFTFDKVEFDLRSLLEDFSSLISLKCEESGLHFYYNIDPGTPCKLVGDPLRLNQVLTNLVTNAFKFTEKGSITVHISAKSRLSNWKNKTTLLFAVQDTGSGVSEEQEQYLFQPFTQADKSITRKFGGTGLGLAICKNLVEMMGGSIWYKSNNGKGSTFSFTSTFEIIDNTTFYDGSDRFEGRSAIVMSRFAQSATELSLQLRNFGFTLFQTLSIDEILIRLKQSEEQGKDISGDIIFIDCTDFSFNWQDAVQTIAGAMKKGHRVPLVLTGPQRLSTHFYSKKKQNYDYFLVTPITPSRLLDAIHSAFDMETPHTLPHQALANKQRGTHMMDTQGGATILLVEDNEINSQIAEAYLKSQNYSVISARNGKEALDILIRSTANQIHAVLMDIQMPVMDGYSTTKAIRELKSPVASIPIIALTAHAMPEEREKCLQVGMNAYVTKPIDANDMFETLGGLITRHPRPGQQNVLLHEQLSIPESILSKTSSLNMKTGLTQVMNDPTLYIDLLKTFVTKYKTWPVAIRAACNEKDLEKCRYLVHTLKGVAANLGMEKLFSLCVRLEMCIRAKDMETIDQHIDEVESETQLVCNFLREWLDKNRSKQWQQRKPDSGLDSKPYNLDDLTETLLNALENNSSKALKQLQILRSQLNNDDSFVFDKIEQYAKELDFAKARDLLLEWQQK